MTDARCVIGSKPHAAHVGLLCEFHLGKLSATLRDVEDQAVMLDAQPSMATRTGSGGGGLASERAPVRLDVLAYRDPRTRPWSRDTQPAYAPPPPKSFGPWCLFCDHETCTAWRVGRRRDLHDDEHDAGSDRITSILGVLHTWARRVREERGLTGPAQVTVTGERDLLTRNLDWLAGQPYIEVVYTQLRQLLAGLRAVNGTQPDKPVGSCYLPAETGPCGGHIWFDAAAGYAHCGRCRSTWDGPQLALLNYEMEKAQAEARRPKTPDGRPMCTAAELAADLGTSVNAVRLRLSKLRVKAQHGSYYDPDLLLCQAS